MNHNQFSIDSLIDRRHRLFHRLSEFLSEVSALNVVDFQGENGPVPIRLTRVQEALAKVDADLGLTDPGA